MKNISMCPGVGCEIKETCYRYKAVPKLLNQPWIIPQYDPTEKTCWSYLEIKEGA